MLLVVVGMVLRLKTLGAYIVIVVPITASHAVKIFVAQLTLTHLARIACQCERVRAVQVTHSCIGIRIDTRNVQICSL